MPLVSDNDLIRLEVKKDIKMYEHTFSKLKEGFPLRTKYYMDRWAQREDILIEIPDKQVIDEPSIIYKCEDSVSYQWKREHCTEEFMKNNPSYICIYNRPYEKKIQYEWIWTGKFHRTDGPAILCMSRTHGCISYYEEYMVNGLTHREGGLPAEIYEEYEFKDDSTVSVQKSFMWYSHDEPVDREGHDYFAMVIRDGVIVSTRTEGIVE